MLSYSASQKQIPQGEFYGKPEYQEVGLSEVNIKMSAITLNQISHFPLVHRCTNPISNL